MEEIIFFLILLGIGYSFGIVAEKNHYKDIKLREQETLSLAIASFGAKQSLPDASDAKLFVGTVVISSDYFKTFVMALRNILGGRVVAYESLLDRGRREALLRVKEQAIAWGATEVLNIRYETSTLGGNNQKGIAAIEVIAYGTAIR
ncbi:MAG: heavy metal-binding domain-containing protein [Phormidium sp. BM_Day4_Bin.17]|nr:heavy metal-binding domain-containing protein [Phormidium sp. BM_Day4_Bin.17]UCJ11335.1 MAG: heavy metal-binding domain-containing protein [Phormidium sp. PBR-2020]